MNILALRKAIDAGSRPHTGVAAGLLALAVVGSASAGQPPAHTLEAANLAHASFGSVEIVINAKTIGPKATNLFYRTDRESVAYSDCNREDGSCPPEVTLWQDTIKALNGTDGVEMLTAVNTAVNSMITYRDDRIAYGKADHWATPTESLTGYGDCEDYAIVKYLSLIQLGIPHDRMRIVVLKDNKRQIGHAVLAVSLGATTYVLDNVRTQATLDSDLTHYQPIYSVNSNQQWLNVAVRPRSDQVAASDVGVERVGAIAPAAQDEAAAIGHQSGTQVE